MNYLRFILATLVFFFVENDVLADNYTINVGETQKIYCTASAPGNGWITHAFFELENADDANYLALNSYSSDCYASIKGLRAKSLVKIRVTYAYSYQGTYDKKVHVGSAIYYDYVTIKETNAATAIAFNPSSADIHIGETVKLKIEMTPSNASTSFEWGVVESLSSRPSTYEITSTGNVISVTAKKATSVYLLAQTSNGHTAVAVVKATKNGPSEAVVPTGIKLSTTDLKLKAGNKVQLDYTLTPENASTTMSWKSSDESVATVNAKGEITGVNTGTATITASTSNNIHAICLVHVRPMPTSVALPESIVLTKGYSRTLHPTLTPAGTETTFSWTSSNKTVVAVSSHGILTAKKIGESTITVTCQEGHKAQCKVSVVEAPTGQDATTIRHHIETIKDLLNKTIDNN